MSYLKIVLVESFPGLLLQIRATIAGSFFARIDFTDEALLGVKDCLSSYLIPFGDVK
jgi:hypothetical protein